MFHTERYGWKLPLSWGPTRFVEALRGVDGLLFPTTIGATNVRYGFKEAAQPLDVALSISRGAYLCYYTAMSHHGLTDQRPRSIHINVEQGRKGERGSLTQAGIDAAFARPQRMSQSQSKLDGGYHLVRVSSMSTGRVGVMRTPEGRSVTNPERTLVDATVRPAYSGGVDEVLEAYRRAASRISINKLASVLERLDYLYPYHQVVGWYLTATGAYDPHLVDRFRRMPQEFDFYVAHDMSDKAYDEEWRVFYPSSLVIASGINRSTKKSK